MRILVTNDDGIYSPGLAALADVAATFGDVRIVAPDVEMSAQGHAITPSRPLSYKRTPICVKRLPVTASEHAQLPSKGPFRSGCRAPAARVPAWLSARRRPP
jgi:Survival protein SurE